MHVKVKVSAQPEAHHWNMAKVVVIHHLHNLEHTVVWCDCHQPCSRRHDVLDMYICGALALDNHLSQVICTSQKPVLSLYHKSQNNQ